MAEVHLIIKNIDASGNQVVFHNPGQPPLPPGTGQAVATQAAAKGTATSGTVNNGATNAPQIVFNNPA